MKSNERFLIIEYTDLKNKSFTQGDILIYSYIKSYIRTNPKELFKKSNSYIAEELGLTKTTVINSLKHLEKLKVIKIKYGSSKGVYTNRTIELRNIKDETISDTIELFNKVYKRIKNKK